MPHSPSVPTNTQRQRVAAWVESPRVQQGLIAVIVLNAIVLGLYTSPAMRADYGSLLNALDAAALAVFVVELALKLWAHGWRFFKSGWNVFDFIIVGIALIPASGPLAVLRALRILRVLRLASMLPQLRFVVEALLRAIPGIAAISGLMVLLFYIAAVLATSLFGERYPELFGSLIGALYTLFQIMTLDSWSSGIARPIMAEYPWAWVFFVPFVLLATFTMLNLFIAIIVNTMQTLHADGPETKPATAQDVQALREEIRALRDALAERRG
ncbi:MAG: ion transporter [Pseudomonadota bacterium]|nr:ion transporter [Pseudomonadota bacterium]